MLSSLIGGSVEFTDFSEPDKTTTGTISDEMSNLLRNENFKVLLIGLDGGVKLRQTELLTKEKLFSTIDAMPMRRAEISND